MSLRSAIEIAMQAARRIAAKPSERPVLPASLSDEVLYGACRQCGWRANVQGCGMAGRCPECGHGMTLLGGTIAEVAARLDQFPEQQRRHVQ